MQLAEMHPFLRIVMPCLLSAALGLRRISTFCHARETYVKISSLPVSVALEKYSRRCTSYGKTSHAPR